VQGKLIFKLPEEDAEFQMAVKASAAFCALSEYDNYLRGRLKYEDLSEPVDTALQAARDKLYEIRTENGLLGVE
jgi:hypothetical protein